MKQSIKFPYKVFIDSIQTELLNNNTDFYEINANVPDVVFSESGIGVTDHNDKISLISEVNCSSTIFRKCYRSENLKNLNFSFPKKEVSNSFTIDHIFVAKESLTLGGETIEKGMPVAHLGSFSINIDKKRQGLISFETSDDDKISYSFSGHVIKINIPKNEYENLLNLKNRPIIKQFLISQFAQIALLEACKYLRNESAMNHLSWYKELLGQWQKFDEGNKEYPEETDFLKLINFILGDPSLKFTRLLIQKENIDRDE